MNMLLPDQVAEVAQQAGFAYGKGLDIAVAIAKAESGYDADATNLNTNGTTDYGLWQINSVHLEPGGDLAGWTSKDLLDPAKNAQAAWIVSSHGTNFGPWVTYRTGAFKTWMVLAQTARRLAEWHSRATAAAAALSAPE